VDRMRDLSAFAARLGVPVVIDHMGRPAAAAPGAARELLALVRDGECYVKLSAPYRMSAEAPPWRDVTSLAHALIRAAPEQCVWATDWPHTQFESISEGDLLEALRAWCPDEGTRDTILRATPLRLFGVAPGA
jgi:2-pyrone-4,6-dicarboxylate lactonase